METTSTRSPHRDLLCANVLHRTPVLCVFGTMLWLGFTAAAAAPGPNANADIKGRYRGLFSDGVHWVYHGGSFGGASQTPVQLSGMVDLTITARGRYSGRISLPSASYAVSGKLSWESDMRAVATNSIVTLAPSPLLPPGAPSAGVRLGIVLDRSTGQMEAEVQQWQYFGLLRKDIAVLSPQLCQSGGAAPAPGVYNVVMPPPGSGTNDGPAGYSYGHVRVRRSGRVDVSLVLADAASPISTRGFLTESNRVAILGRLPGGQGFLTANLEFTNGEEGGLTATQARWLKWPGKSPTYTNGFDAHFELIGSRYVEPKRGVNVVGWTSGMVEIQADNVMQLTEAIGWDLKRFTVVGENPRNLRLKLAARSGLISGSFVPENETKPIPFRALLLPAGREAAGFFVFGDQTGSVYLGPLTTD